MYQKSWSYAILSLRYMVHGCNYFSFWTVFCPFTALTARKIKIWIKKKHLEVSSFYASVPKTMIICYTVPEMYGAQRMELLFFILGYFLPFYHPNGPKNQNFKKSQKNKNNNNNNKKTNKKTTWRYHFRHVYQNLWLDDVQLLRCGAPRTDGWKKWHIEVGAPPKKNQYFEQSATLFGMKKKKKRILKQVLLSNFDI